MAFRKLKHKLLSGSLNLLPPGDLLPPEDAAQLQNFRVDQAGNLRSRKGTLRLNAVELPDADVHTLGPRAGPAFYVGAGTNLYRDAQGSPIVLPPRSRSRSLAPRSGGFAYTQIATGFSGEPLGIAPAQHWAWFMNRSKQGKDNGSTFYDWQPIPPSTAPTVEAQSIESKVIADVAASEAWKVGGDLSSTTPVFDSDISHNGTSLKLDITAAGTGWAELVTSLDLTIGGEARDDDQFVFWVYIYDPRLIENVHVLIDVGDGTFANDYYIASFPREFFTAYNPAGEVWIPLEIHRKLTEGDVTTRFGFERVGTPTPDDWSQVAGIRVQTDTRDATVVHWDDFYCYGGPEGPLNGEIRYFVTFDTDAGHESNPSPASDWVVFDKQSALLTGIPTSGDAQVTIRHLYRQGGTLSQTLRVATLLDNTTTTYTDKLHDDDATDLNVPLEADHDPPPAGRGLAGPYYERLLAFSSADFPNRLWWTPANRPWYFRDSQSASSGDWVDIGDWGDDILAVSPHKRVAFIYLTHSIWRLVGDPSDGELEVVDVTTGLAGAGAWASAGDLDYFMGDFGVYRLAGDRKLWISEKIDPIFKGQWTEVGATILIPPISRQYRSNSVMTFVGGRLWFSYPEEGKQFPSITLIYDEETGRWAHHKLNLNAGVTGFRALYYDPRPLAPLGGTTSALVVETENGLLDGDNAIPLVYHSRDQDLGVPDNEKTWADVVIDYETGAAATVLTVKAYFNNGQTSEAIGSIYSETRATAVFKINGGLGTRARNCAVRIEGNATTEVVIYGIFLHYFAEARAAKTWDTDEFLPGDGRLVEAKEVQLDIEVIREQSLRIYSDLPGNSLALRQTKTISPTSGRRPVQVPFPQVDGRMFRLVLIDGEAVTTPGGFYLYAAKLLRRVIGVYVDAYEAAAGFQWDSTEIDFGTHLIKQAKSILVVTDTDGPLDFLLRSDLPGQNLALRQQTPVNTETTTTGRRYFRINLPDRSIEGRQFRLLVSSSNAYKLFRAALEIRPIGVYIEQYEAEQGYTWDSTELDLGIREVKELRQVELDIDDDGSTTLTVYSDLPGQDLRVRRTEQFNTETTTTGRRKVNLPILFEDSPPGAVLGVIGRLFRFLLSGGSAWRLYGARALVRPYGYYIEAEESQGGALYDSSEVDFGTQKVKQVRQLEFDYASAGSLTAHLYSDLPGNQMIERHNGTLPQATRRTYQLTVPEIAEARWVEGRLLRVTLTSAAAYQLYAVRAQVRVIGTYVEAYEGAANLLWDSTEVDLGVKQAKEFIELRFDIDTDGPLTLSVYTDLPGEAMALRHTAIFNTEDTTTGRRTLFAPLPAFLEGRFIRVTLGGATAYRLYEAAVAFRPFGRYINGPLALPPVGLGEDWRTIDLDFGTERVKLFQELEIEARTDGPVLVTLYTDLPGETMTARYQKSIDSSGSNQRSRNFKLRLPPTTKGRLLRAEIHGTSTCRLYKMRVRLKPVGEAGRTDWAWAEIPVEQTPDFPSWGALPVEPTAPAWQWEDLPLPKTPQLLSWVDLNVVPTPSGWTLADFPVDPTADRFETIDLPVDPVE